MKQCSSCGKQFTDENDFCPDDGAALHYSESNPHHPIFGEQQTQVLTRPIATQSSNSMMFLLIGVLFVMVTGLAVFVLFRTGNENNSRFETVSKQSDEVSANNNATSSTNIKNNLSGNNAPYSENTPPQTVSPSGRWSGDWSSPSGAYLNVVFTLDDDGSGAITGKIDWTLRRTRRPDKMNKVGLSAVEYVRGTFDPLTRVYSLKGYRKDDPYDVLVLLDSYRLNLSPEGQRLTGSARNGGKWNASIDLRR